MTTEPHLPSPPIPWADKVTTTRVLITSLDLLVTLIDPGCSEKGPVGEGWDGRREEDAPGWGHRKRDTGCQVRAPQGPESKGDHHWE
ncbi:hypothetical protein ACOMHN_008746 [Nucella lapillus]